MIQGLQALPWIQAARTDNKMPPDCSMCRDSTSEAIRTSMGCAYLPPLVDADGKMQPPHAVWKHEGDRTGGTTICPGYTTTLPDVIDIARAHRHWTKGELGTVLGGRDGLPQTLTDGIEILDDAVNRLEQWRMSESSRRGGAK